MPEVSVILPNYNHQKYISARIKSILEQDYTDFEIIILDDKSTDESLVEIAKFEGNKKISHILKNVENSGSTFKQWQKGIYLAQGKYIWIAESDDLADPSFLRKTVTALEKDTSVGVVYSPSIWIDDNDNEIHRPDHESEPQKWNGNHLIESEFLTGNLIYNASSAVFRKELLQKVDFTTVGSFRYVGDWLFWVQLIANTQVERIPERLNYFRRHHGNVSFKADQDGLFFLEGIKILQYIYKNHTVSFLTQRKTALRWAKKLSRSNIKDKSKVLKKLPVEMKTYFKIFNIIS